MRTRILASAILVTFALAACDDAPKTTSPEVAPTGDTLIEPSGQPAAAESARKRPGIRNKGIRRPPRGGPRVVVRTALRDLGLTDEQKDELNQAVNGLKPTEEAAAAEKELLEALAAGMRAGKLDDALVADKLAAVKKHAGAARDREHEVLDKLHAMLTPEQRKTLVEKMSPAEGTEPAAWLVDEGPQGPRMGQKSVVLVSLNPLMLTRGLQLSPEQRTKVRELTRNTDRKDKLERAEQVTEDRNKRVREVLDAFVTDTFDAKKLAGEGLTKEASESMDEKIEQMRSLLEALDEEQRKQVADNLERGGKRGRHARKMRGPEQLSPRE